MARVEAAQQLGRAAGGRRRAGQGRHVRGGLRPPFKGRRRGAAEAAAAMAARPRWALAGLASRAGAGGLGRCGLSPRARPR
jgi:hypothetical protein